MNLLGIGVDLVEVARINQSLERLGEKFLERVFTPDEIAYCAAMKAPGPFYAARFAAKEAVSKAFGCGIGEQVGWLEIEVRRRESGEPFVVLHGAGAELARRRGVDEIRLSLSHTDHYAVAQVVITGAQ